MNDTRFLWVTAYQTRDTEVLVTQRPDTPYLMIFKWGPHGNVQLVDTYDYREAQASGHVTFYSIPDPF